ncbi:helix-turn-helix transcriptional regulator [bacterium]|jgi:DNA-binding NarL/FixJ family response regulator|nr:helix-turn-helix transcriptional regulator [bacterium]
MKVAATLSRRENQIAEMVAWGASKKDISNELLISTRTVETTVRKVLKKTDCTKSNELSAWWFCTRYLIPFSDSPIFKKMIAALTFISLTIL